MQNKGVIKFFAIAFAIICLFQLSFTFVARRVDNKAEKFALNNTAAEAKALSQGNEVLERTLYDSLYNAKHQYFLDSVGNDVIYNILIRKYTYKECKARELNLGLDLRGGMNVMMEVSTADVVRALSGYSADTFFNSVMEEAIQRNKVEANTNFVDVFGRVWNERDPNAQMAAIFSFEMKDVNANSTNEEVIRAIKNETGSAFDRTYQILRTRIDKFGVAQPNVQKLAQTDRILVELPGVKDPARVRKLLQGTAQLEFWETYEFSEMIPYLQSANEYLVSVQKLAEEGVDEKASEELNADAQEPAAESAEAESDLLAQVAKAQDSAGIQNMDAERWQQQNPLFAILMPSLFQGDEQRMGPVVGYAREKDMAKVDEMMALAKSKFPRNVKFVWSVKPVQANTDIYSLIALKVSTRDGQAPLGGDVVTDARQDFGQNGGPGFGRI